MFRLGSHPPTCLTATLRTYAPHTPVSTVTRRLVSEGGLDKYGARLRCQRTRSGLPITRKAQTIRSLIGLALSGTRFGGESPGSDLHHRPIPHHLRPETATSLRGPTYR